MKPSNRKKFVFQGFVLEWDDRVFPLTTDSLILGAWTPLIHRESLILDAGCGSGILSLMMAQRNTKAQIEAIDQSEHSIQQTRYNIRQSPWSSRINSYHASFGDWIESRSVSYDLIVSNPPYFSHHLANEEPEKSRMRHWNGDSWMEFLEKMYLMIRQKGMISMIFPYSEKDHVLDAAASVGLFPWKVLNIRARDTEHIIRIACVFSKRNKMLDLSEMSIYKQASSVYTDAFHRMTSSFYRSFNVIKGCRH